jgi:hypothetical protein
LLIRTCENRSRASRFEESFVRGGAQCFFTGLRSGAYPGSVLSERPLPLSSKNLWIF